MTGEKYLLVKGTAGLGNRLEKLLLTAMLMRACRTAGC